MIIYHIERKVDGEWRDICRPTEHEELARKICHMKASNDCITVRVATYDDREPEAHVLCMVSDTGWKEIL
jgi:hypothetical protein